MEAIDKPLPREQAARPTQRAFDGKRHCLTGCRVLVVAAITLTVVVWNALAAGAAYAQDVNSHPNAALLYSAC